MSNNIKINNDSISNDSASDIDDSSCNDINIDFMSNDSSSDDSTSNHNNNNFMTDNNDIKINDSDNNDIKINDSDNIDIKINDSDSDNDSASSNHNIDSVSNDSVSSNNYSMSNGSVINNLVSSDSASNIELYNELFAYRIMIQDVTNDESHIIIELKLYLINKRFNNINNILFLFYQYFSINITREFIENAAFYIITGSINNSTSSINNTSTSSINNTSTSSINNSTTSIINNSTSSINNNDSVGDDSMNDINNLYGQINNISDFFDQMIQMSNRSGNPYYNTFIDDNILNNLDDVVVSLDNNDLNNLKTYSNDNKININCCVCLEDIKNQEIICELNCAHKFHDKCIKYYLDNYNHKCPICRISTGNTKINI